MPLPDITPIQIIHFDPFNLRDAPVAPAGTWTATCINVRNDFRVPIARYQREDEYDLKDLATFKFGFYDTRGGKFQIAPRSMPILNSPRASLIQFLKDWLGCAPVADFAYEDLKGKRANITIANMPYKSQARQGQFYAVMTGIGPVPNEQAPPPAAETAPNATDDQSAPEGAPAAPAPVAPQDAPPAPVVNDIPF